MTMQLDFNNVGQWIAILAPLLVLQLGLAIFCLVLIWKKGVGNLNQWIWTAIVVFVNMIGPVAYLLFGRKRWTDDDRA